MNNNIENIITTITAPALNATEYAEGLNTTFDNINNNFTILANHDFVKGDDGSSVTISYEQIYDGNNYTSIGEKLREAIIADDNRKNGSTPIKDINFDDRLKDTNVKIGMIKNESGNYVSSLYFIFLDSRYAQENLSDMIDSSNDAQNNDYTNAVDLSCVLIYNGQNNEFEILDNAFPTMYYTPGLGMCWKLYGEKTGIPVQGIEGKEGKSSSIVIARCDEFNKNEEQNKLNGVVKDILIDGEYVNTNELSDEQLLEYNGQTVLIIGPRHDKIKNESFTDFYFGSLTSTGNGFEVTTAYDKPWTSYVDKAAVINLLRDINIYRAQDMNESDSDNTIKLPGLFIPIAINENSQSAHLITATNLNGDIDNFNTPDLLITPVNNIDKIGDDNDNISKCVERIIKVQHPNNPSQYISYKFTGTPEIISDDNDYYAGLIYKWEYAGDENNDQLTKEVWTYSLNPNVGDNCYESITHNGNNGPLKIYKFYTLLNGFKVNEENFNTDEYEEHVGSLSINYDVNVLGNNDLNVGGNTYVNKKLNVGDVGTFNNFSCIIGNKSTFDKPYCNLFSTDELALLKDTGFGYDYKGIDLISCVSYNKSASASGVKEYKIFDINALDGLKMYDPSLTKNPQTASITLKGDATFNKIKCDDITCNENDLKLNGNILYRSFEINIPGEKFDEEEWYYDEAHGLPSAVLKFSSNRELNESDLVESVKLNLYGESCGIYSDIIGCDINTNGGSINTMRGSIDTFGGIITAGAFYQSSDNRLKDFGEPIPVDLEKLRTLKKNYFTWKEGNKDTQIGMSAQEIQEIYPELVTTNEEGMFSVAYDKLSVVALAAVDKLYDENKQLEERIKALEDQFEALLSRINY